MEKHVTQQGFSLIELVVVIVLLGLLAGGAGLLIVTPIESYDAQVRRQQLVDQGEMALRQIAREVRQALPNSVRVAAVGAGWAVEIVPTVDGARYRDEVGGDFVAAFDTLDFVAADNDFNMLGAFNTLTPPVALPAGQRLVIFNTSAASIYTDAALNSNPGIVTTAATALALTLNTPATDDPEHHINMAPIFQFSQQSPGQRVFIVVDPISYVCDPATNQITRHTGYGFSVVQPTPPGGATNIVVSQLTACNMTYSAGTAQRGGILTVELTISDSGESVSLLHQIHVTNLP